MSGSDGAVVVDLAGVRVLGGRFVGLDCRFLVGFGCGFLVFSVWEELSETLRAAAVFDSEADFADPDFEVDAVDVELEPLPDFEVDAVDVELEPLPDFADRAFDPDFEVDVVDVVDVEAFDFLGVFRDRDLLLPSRPPEDLVPFFLGFLSPLLSVELPSEPA